MRVREPGEPAVAQIVGRARLAGDHDVVGQGAAHRAARAALHDLDERLVQRVDGARIRGLRDLELVALQQLAVLTDDATYGAQRYAESAVRERVVDLRDLDRRQRERAEQHGRVQRGLLL